MTSTNETMIVNVATGMNFFILFDTSCSLLHILMAAVFIGAHSKVPY